MTSVVWFRRDLRLADHPALAEAAAAGPVVALFVDDPALAAPAGAPRRAFLSRCLEALDRSTGGRLVVRAGDPVAVVPAVAGEVGAADVFVTADAGVYGRRRDDGVEQALTAAGRRLVRVSSPYAVEPGSVLTADGRPYRVFTPFYRSWKDHGWPDPLPAPAVTWVGGVRSDGVPPEPPLAAALPPAGEDAAVARLDAFLAGPAASYDGRRDAPAADATTRLSPYLKYGCISPRQVLAPLGRADAAEKLRSELAWRDFCADVLWHRPDSAWRSVQEPMAALRVDEGADADARFEAWASGCTGYPLVDAGMRQLLAEAWMPNRVRMVTASFLAKDLHVDWARGARWFLRHLVDGDLASNNAGWQWVAGTGTDPAPFFRVFNPVAQAKQHDPAGDYVRRWVLELAGVPAPDVFEPWTTLAGPAAGYPPPVVDHASERAEALARYEEVRRGR